VPSCPELAAVLLLYPVQYVQYEVFSIDFHAQKGIHFLHRCHPVMAQKRQLELSTTISTRCDRDAGRKGLTSRPLFILLLSFLTTLYKYCSLITTENTKGLVHSIHTIYRHTPRIPKLQGSLHILIRGKGSSVGSLLSLSHVQPIIRANFPFSYQHGPANFQHDRLIKISEHEYFRGRRI
jgi:hypothetical protein